MDAEALASKIHEKLANILPRIPPDTIRVTVDIYGVAGCSCSVEIKFELTGINISLDNLGAELLPLGDYDIRGYIGGVNFEITKDGNNTKLLEELSGYREIEYRQKIEELLRSATKPLPIPIREAIIPQINPD